MALFRTMLLAGGLCLAAHAQASFHFMQIEQVIGGVHGDVSQQAVQLRMRAGGQNQVQFSRLVAYDATGDNPVLLMDFDVSVPGGNAGDRVLVTTFDFASPPAPAVFTNNGGSASAVVVRAFAPRGGDCDDTDPAISPAATEVPDNGRNDDCDGLADEDAFGNPSTNNNDNDLDGVPIAAGDCDDTRVSTRPGASEVVGDLRDNDCDRLTDESVDNVPTPDGIDHDNDDYGPFARLFSHGFE